MSATTAAARRAMLLNPFMGPGASASRVVFQARQLQTSRIARELALQRSTTALFIPVRCASTDSHRHDASSGPPPGFNLEEAKKPLPKSESSDTSKQAAKINETAAEKNAKRLETDEAIVAASPGTMTEHVDSKDAALNKQDGKKDEKKLTLSQKIKKEIRHYWDGTKLLATEVKISSRLALKMAGGYELTRREHRQLQRTTQDLGRLVPFSVFVIVPFAELLLPVALKLFPNLLPSTYEDQKSKDKKATALRSNRKEVSSFLRQTLRETGLPLSPATAQSAEFANFFRKVRATGEQPTAEDVIKVCKIFKDDLTLDNLSRPQLVSMCRYMNLNTFGTDMMLRYQIRHRMRQIKRDDRIISYEGVDAMTVSELQMACASRGIKTYSVSPSRLREDLQTWLDLRLKEGVPSTLLVLSNAYYYSQTPTTTNGAKATQIEALTGVLSSIPEELYHEIELEVSNAEGAATNKQRLEVLKEQEELIDEENEQNHEHSDHGMATPRDVENIDEKEERQAGAHEAGVEKDQVSEAVIAEQEAAAVARETQSAETTVEAGEKKGL